MKKKLFLLGVRLLLFCTLILGLFLGSIYLGLFGHVYSENELKDFKNEEASLVLSDDGSLIGKYFADNRTNIRFEQIPNYLIQALVATEDARYFEHDGVDSRSLLRVLVKSLILQDKRSGGGSTLTQQLAKNMYGRKNYGFLSMPVNKTKEVILAQRLEDIYSKEDILTLYLNTVPFGENVLGIESAAHRYFNKRVEELDIQESAVLVGMLKANTYYNPRLYPDNALKRRNVVLEQMEKYDYIDQKTSADLQKAELKLDYANLQSEGPANYFLVSIKREASDIIEKVNQLTGEQYDLKKSGLIIETTLDRDLQLYALQAYKSHLGKMQARLNRQYQRGSSREQLDALVQNQLDEMDLNDEADQRRMREVFSWKGTRGDSISLRDSLKASQLLLHAGLLALDPNDGAVKCWVGGIDFRSQPYDQIFAQRQLASAFKPVLYVSALESGVRPCHYLDNDQIVLSDFDNWQPQNYDHSLGGMYSMAGALSKSMNIPTVNLFFQQDFDHLRSVWDNLGFSQELLNKPATALGTTSASLFELARAYASFANGGYQVDPYMIRSIKTASGEILYAKEQEKSPNRLLGANSVKLLNAMLHKAMKAGTGGSMKSVYGVQADLAGKTGTSQDYADAWFVAYNPNLVIANRVGANSPLVHFNKGSDGSGSALALPLTARTLQKVQRNSVMSRKYFKSFEPLDAEFSEALICQDYVETSQIEDFFDDLFSDETRTFEEASKKARKKAKKEKRKSWFKRLFKKKNDS